VLYFRNREQAGRQLSLELVKYSSQNPVVFGIPRGGVPVAFEVARSLNVPVNVLVTQKLGVPGHEELPFGAIAEDDARFVDSDVVRSARVSPGESEMVIRAAVLKVAQRARLYRKGKPLPSLRNRTVVLVDDGIAAGAEVRAAILSLRKMAPRQLIVAAPAISESTFDVLRPQVDKLVTLHATMPFLTTGHIYEKYPEVEDEEVLSLLKISENFPYRAVPDELPPAA